MNNLQGMNGGTPPQIMQLNPGQLQQLMARYTSETELATRFGANTEEGRKHMQTAAKIRNLLVSYSNQTRLRQQQQQAQQQRHQAQQQQKQKQQISENLQNGVNNGLSNNSMDMLDMQRGGNSMGMQFNNNGQSKLGMSPMFNNNLSNSNNGNNNNNNSNNNSNSNNNFNVMNAMKNEESDQLKNEPNSDAAMGSSGANTNGTGAGDGQGANVPLMIQVQNLKKLNQILQEYQKKLNYFRSMLQKPDLPMEAKQKLTKDSQALQLRMEQVKMFMLKLNQSIRVNRSRINSLVPGQQQSQQPGQPGQQGQQQNQLQLQQNRQLQLQKQQQQQQQNLAKQGQLRQQPPMNHQIQSPNMNMMSNAMMDGSKNIPILPNPALANQGIMPIMGNKGNGNNGNSNMLMQGMLNNLPMNQAMLANLSPQQRASFIQQYQKQQQMKAAVQAAAMGGNNNQMQNQIPINGNQPHMQNPRRGHPAMGQMSPHSGNANLVGLPSLNMQINNPGMINLQLPLGSSPISAHSPLIAQRGPQQNMPIINLNQHGMQQQPPQLAHLQLKQPVSLLAIPLRPQMPVSQPQRQLPEQNLTAAQLKQQPPQQLQNKLVEPQIKTELAEKVLMSLEPKIDPAVGDNSEYTASLILKNILKEPVSSIPILKELNVKPIEPVLLENLKPSIYNGFACVPILSSPALIKLPELDLESGDGNNRVVTKRKLVELVKTVGMDDGDGETYVGGDAELILLDLADEFVTSVSSFACQLAKRRKADAIESKDIQLHLEKNWNIKIPGYANDEIRSIRKWHPTASYTQKINGVEVSRSVNRQPKTD